LYNCVTFLPFFVGSYAIHRGSFFIPYFLALIFIGIPILILEICLGQLYQTGDVGSFGGMNRRLRGIGLSSVFGAYIVVVYYIPLITWTVNGFFDTFTGFDEKYGITLDDEGELINPYEIHFKPKIIGMESLNEGSNNPTRLVPANVGYLAAVYVIMYFCVAFGIKATGRIAYFSMGFPILLLFIFFFLGVTLDGAGDGIRAYIGVWDMSVLRENGEIWSTAVSQIFFSIGISWGIFTAYGR
jgi:solute carrier family 6 GABA transporter-like protein 1